MKTCLVIDMVNECGFEEQRKKKLADESFQRGRTISDLSTVG